MRTIETKNINNKALEAEILSIINSGNSYPKKCKELLAIKLAGRKGGGIAEKLIKQYCEKYNNYCSVAAIINGKANASWRYAQKLKSRYEKDMSYFFYDVNDYFKYYSKRHISYRLAEAHYKKMFKPLFHVYFDYLPEPLENMLKSSASPSKIHHLAKSLFAKLKQKHDEIQAFVEESGLSAAYINYSCEKLLEMQSEHNLLSYCRAAGYFFVKDTEIEKDWNAYSKGWHKQYGPKKTVTGRFLYIRKDGKEEKISISSYKGNWLINAIVEHFDLKPVKVAKEMRAVQLNPYFDVKKIRQIGAVVVYELSFLGQVQQYCAAVGETTYHDDTAAKAVTGLRKKIEEVKAAAIAEEAFLDRRLTAKFLHEKHGFCWAGMREFADAVGIDADGEYSLRELRAACKNKISTSYKFAKELKKIGVL
jgi:hypothetical protein